MRNHQNANIVQGTELRQVGIPPKPTRRSLIPAHQLRINRAWIENEFLLIDVVDLKSGRQEILQILPPGGIKHVPRKESIKLLIRLYIKYDLLSQEQFICLTEYGKHQYVTLMREGFYPRLCLVWMKQLIDYLDHGTNSEINYNPIQTLNKTIQRWAQKERSKT